MNQSIVCCALILSAFFGCAQPTGYVKRDHFSEFNFGYNDKRISDDEFCIIATGNEASTAEHVAKLALYHAAKVTLKNKHQRFKISNKSEKNLPRHQMVTISTLLIPIPITIHSLPIGSVPLGEKTTRGSKSILIIRLVDGAEPEEPEHIDAQKVVAELDPIFNKKRTYE